jgi:hypothetical protein
MDTKLLQRGFLAVVLAGALGAPSAWADGIIDAKVQCQVEYGTKSEMGQACKEGIELARRSTGVDDALGRCTADRQNGARISACQKGVELYARLVGRARGSRDSSFSYSWTQPQTGFQVDVGDYQASVGNQKVVDDCMRQFDGSDHPPSCMSGITVQHKAPPPAGAK